MDREGIENLYAEYAALVYRTCRAILVDHHDAEDAAQEIFAKLLAHDQAAAVANPRKWLLQVTRNHCIDRRRADARRRASAAEPHGAAGEDAERRSVARAEIRWLLSRLRGRQREVIVRQAMLDEDLDTVAARLGITYGAAAQLIHRARRLLLQADQGLRAGLALVGGRLSGARGWARDHQLRMATACRESLRRLPTDPALALPAALLITLMGAAPAGGLPLPATRTLPGPGATVESAVAGIEVDAPPTPIPSPEHRAANAVSSSSGSAPTAAPRPSLLPRPTPLPNCLVIRGPGTMTCVMAPGLQTDGLSLPGAPLPLP